MYVCTKAMRGAGFGPQPAGLRGLDFIFVAGRGGAGCGPDHFGAGQDMAKYEGWGGLRAE